MELTNIELRILEKLRNMGERDRALAIQKIEEMGMAVNPEKSD